MDSHFLVRRPRSSASDGQWWKSQDSGGSRTTSPLACCSLLPFPGTPKMLPESGFEVSDSSRSLEGIFGWWWLWLYGSPSFTAHGWHLAALANCPVAYEQRMPKMNALDWLTVLARAEWWWRGGGCWGKRRMMKQLLWVSFSESDRVVGSLLHLYLDARPRSYESLSWSHGPDNNATAPLMCDLQSSFTSVFLSYKDTTPTRTGVTKSLFYLHEIYKELKLLSRVPKLVSGRVQA